MSRWIPTAIRRELFFQPCAICADEGDIEIDHIIPTSRGGESTRDNLQPLCRVCNAIKRDGKSNEDVAAWIAAHPSEHAAKRAKRDFIRNRRYL